MGELLAEFLSRNHIKNSLSLGSLSGHFPAVRQNFCCSGGKTVPSGHLLWMCCNDDFARLIIERLRHEGVITVGSML